MTINIKTAYSIYKPQTLKITCKLTSSCYLVTFTWNIYRHDIFKVIAIIGLHRTVYCFFPNETLL